MEKNVLSVEDQMKSVRDASAKLASLSTARHKEEATMGLLSFLHLLPQPEDLLPKAVEKMLAFMNHCALDVYAPSPENEPLLRLKVQAGGPSFAGHGSGVQRTVKKWRSIPHYTAAQLLCCRYAVFSTET